MYRHYSKKHKRIIRILYYVLILMFILMFYLSIHLTNSKITRVEDYYLVGSGFIIILIVTIAAMRNTLGKLFKFKGIGFILTFLVLLLFRQIIDTLIVSIGLFSIPMLYNDLVITFYKQSLNHGEYFSTYRYFINARD